MEYFVSTVTLVLLIIFWGVLWEAKISAYLATTALGLLGLISLPTIATFMEDRYYLWDEAAAWSGLVGLAILVGSAVLVFSALRKRDILSRTNYKLEAKLWSLDIASDFYKFSPVSLMYSLTPQEKRKFLDSKDPSLYSEMVNRINERKMDLRPLERHGIDYHDYIGQLIFDIIVLRHSMLASRRDIYNLLVDDIKSALRKVQ